MKIVDYTRSVLTMPNDYEKVRPHHIIFAICGLKIVASSTIYRKISEKILSVMSGLTESFIPLVQLGFFPDFIIRWGIRLQLRDHLNILRAESVEQEMKDKMKIIDKLKNSPIAIKTDEANDQHYEVPAKFYDLCLGPRKKYSSGLWPKPSTTFEESEVEMLNKYCELAGVKDGMNIVDLGCGWGSLTLHLAENYPNAKITGISNSNSQREYILSTAAARKYNVSNITIITCNVADDKGALDALKGNDLVMTVEMFEHMKNYETLMKKINSWLKPHGRLFVHIFTHKTFTYEFEEGWMSRNFFTGGTMPSDDLLLYFANEFAIVDHWRVNGQNYEKTSNGWLNYLDRSWKSGELKPVLADAYGAGKEREWYVNWRLFFLACAELWGLNEGQEWIVSLYLFERK
ncbi:cyclopropane-fatty-acyl-phospholipid synthase [Nitzschia inconspicua]|uniref:Cyclopropane-fatty-acyl-phospholipid synthase n=1 Tax=Nitzschia inconspicua TaxID=303405 RepID=A0A9K3PPF4_9STRA|nr:cyclopropane-fatty-acyl-phospholipid synthase [Nitzschia inconspicua]